jgi:hypothetical protein
MLRSLRPNLSRYMYHTSVNFLKEDLTQLSKGKLLAIVQDYLEANFTVFSNYFDWTKRDSNQVAIYLIINYLIFQKIKR